MSITVIVAQLSVGCSSGKGGWGGGKGGKGKGKGDQYYGEDPGPHGSSGGYGNWGAEGRGPPGGGEPGTPIVKG